MNRTSLVAGALAAAVACPALAAPELAPVWTDHAVIQRDAPIRVEGTAGCGVGVAGGLGDLAAPARADAGGGFSLEFPAPASNAHPVALCVHGARGTAATGSARCGR